MCEGKSEDSERWLGEGLGEGPGKGAKEEARGEGLRKKLGGG